MTICLNLISHELSTTLKNKKPQRFLRVRFDGLNIMSWVLNFHGNRDYKFGLFNEDLSWQMTRTTTWFTDRFLFSGKIKEHLTFDRFENSWMICLFEKQNSKKQELLKINFTALAGIFFRKTLAGSNARKTLVFLTSLRIGICLEYQTWIFYLKSWRHIKPVCVETFAFCALPLSNVRDERLTCINIVSFWHVAYFRDHFFKKAWLMILRTRHDHCQPPYFFYACDELTRWYLFATIYFLFLFY
jgi:hypothetical protein